MKEKYEYKFSVVIPIYKVEKYLEEAILSVINQTIGFKENIQMILVNDGSPDNSEQICLKYKEMYPDNIKYIYQENQGVSIARNIGIKHIKGKYTSFLDSDDKWELDAFEKVYDFFEKHYNEISVVGCRIKNFEARDDYHPLDYKFDKNKVVDIDKDINAVQLSMATAFFKSVAIINKEFDKDLKYGEDVKLVTEIILEQKKYGIMKDVIYYYRRRADESSAIQTRHAKKETYLDTINGYYKWLIDYSKEKFGKVIRYIQCILMYDLSFRLKKRVPVDLLGKESSEEYIKGIKYILKYIDDDIILNKDDFYSGYKIHTLSLKYDKDMTKELDYDDGKLLYNGKVISNITKTGLNIKILDIKDKILILDGVVNTFIDKKEYKVFIECDENKKEIELVDEEYKAKDGIDKRILTPQAFRLEIDITKIKKISFLFKYKDAEEKKMNIKFGKFAKINEDISESYYYSDEFIIKKIKNEIKIEKNTKKNHLKSEIKYLKRLIKVKEYKLVRDRMLYYFLRNSKKQLWIFSDAISAGKDNAEYLFEYVQKQNNKNIKSYFVIDGKSEDYKRIKKIGKVIKRDSLKHKIYFLKASKIISSQVSETEENVYAAKMEYMKDLYKYKFVFLQHGVIESDLSKWLHRHNKNIKLFITSAKQEYDSILNGKYGYTDKEVKLTGLPRFDTLESKNENKIIIMPTWRRKIVKWKGDKAEKDEYNKYFKTTEFYEFFNSLINNERLLNKLKEKGYKAKFCLHPAMRLQLCDFEDNEIIEIERDFVNYRKEFAENKLFITDYSSTSFDFAYLKKPVIYTLFDEEEFYANQIFDKGYFSYSKDGFGPACYTVDETVDKIIYYLENGCKMENKYKEKVEKFYKYNDKNNCKRVYEEILKLDNK